MGNCNLIEFRPHGTTTGSTWSTGTAWTKGLVGVEGDREYDRIQPYLIYSWHVTVKRDIVLALRGIHQSTAIHHPRRRETFANDTGGCVMEWSVDVDAMVVNGRDWEGGKYMESALTWCKVIRAAIFHYSCFNYGNRLAMMLLMAILYTIADPALHITHQWRILACNQSVCNTAVIDEISLMFCNAIRIRMFRSVEGHFTDQEAINMIKEMVVLLQYKLQRGRNWIYFNTRIIIIIDAAHTTIPL